MATIKSYISIHLISPSPLKNHTSLPPVFYTSNINHIHDVRLSQNYTIIVGVLYTWDD